MSIGSMGYPDVIAPPELVEKLLGDKLPKMQYRADSELICKRHGMKPTQIPDAVSMFKALECELDVYDVVRERGCEILCNLNYPMDITEAYDIVLDVGTLEHCFNIGQAAFNMAGMVKENGKILHENPFLAGNHGFYGMNPTWYADFYQANGFQLNECKLTTKEGKSVDVPHTGRFRFTAVEINVFAMATRVKVQKLVIPQQTKYAAAGLKGEREVANG